ncbi:hypothetical protein Tco_1486539, partial [Tanacetum coccineum]
KPHCLNKFRIYQLPHKRGTSKQGNQRPSKLLSPKYLSQSSLAEQNRNPSSPKRIYFVNLIIIINKEDEDKEKGSVKFGTTEYMDHEITVEAEREVKSEEEFEEEAEEETEEKQEDNPEYFNTFPTMK